MHTALKKKKKKKKNHYYPSYIINTELSDISPTFDTTFVEDLGEAGPNKMVSDYLDQFPRIWNLKLRFGRQIVLLESSGKLLRIKVTQDLHLTYSKNRGNLGLVLKMKKYSLYLNFIDKTCKIYIFIFV